MANIIRVSVSFVLENFTLTFFVFGLIFASAAIARARRPIGKALVVDRLFAWYVFFSIGVSYFYNFIVHVFFGQIAAEFIGWADSPFQLEVGMASLGFSVVGFIAAWRSFDLRLAAVTGFSIFTLGAAAGHVHQMLAADNFAPGNAGVIFYTDFVVPLFGLLMLWLQHRYGRAASRGRRVGS
jgi:hypothetical protein